MLQSPSLPYPAQKVHPPPLSACPAEGRAVLRSPSRLGVGEVKEVSYSLFTSRASLMVPTALGRWQEEVGRPLSTDLRGRLEEKRSVRPKEAQRWGLLTSNSGAKGLIPGWSFNSGLAGSFTCQFLSVVACVLCLGSSLCSSIWVLIGK